MVNLSKSLGALNARCPVANLYIRAAEYIRAWTSVKHIEDIDVVYLIMHKWSPDVRDTFDNFVRTKAFKMGADLSRNNYVHDWNEVENNVFVSRTVDDVLTVYNDIRVILARDRLTVKESELIVNGRPYLLYGRDEGSAKLLYSLLSMTVSNEQIHSLLDDILGNGLLSRILLDDDFKEKFAVNNAIPLFDKIVRFADFFKLYVTDEILAYASAILLFEVEFTDNNINFFKSVIPAVKNLMITELELESVTVLHHEVHPSLEKIYFSNGVFTDPWNNLSVISSVKDILEAPVVIHNEVIGAFPAKVNAALNVLSEFWHTVLSPSHEIFGANLLAASNEFNQDRSLSLVRSYCDQYLEQFTEPCKVFLYGSNDSTRFSDLVVNKSVTLNIMSFNSDLPFNLRWTDRINVHKTPESFMMCMSDFSDTSIFLYDFVDHEEIRTGRATYRVSTVSCPNSSMARCFDSFSGFFGKASNHDPVKYHGSLPYMIIFRFIPYHSDSDLKVRSVLRRLIHHYSLSYFMPVDFGSLGFTIHAVKRTKMLPKIHRHNDDPLAILDAFVYHAVVVRFAFLQQIFTHKVSWRMFAPFRTLSRHHGYGSTDKHFKVQDVLNFANWGQNCVVTDYNNLFGECDAPEIFTRKNTALAANSKKSKKNQKKNGLDVGKSILVTKSEVVKDFFDRRVNPAIAVVRPPKVKVNVNSPLFKREKAVAAGEAFPI
jgi:hypothetical protein